MQTLCKKSFAGFAAAILAATCLGFAAGGSHKSSERISVVTFGSTTKLNNGNMLPAGTYRMEVPENSQTPAVTFSKDGKVMTTIEAKVVTEQKKNDETEIDSVAQGDAQVLTAIRPAGWAEELVFGPAGQ
jgi:tetraacyldisaccharide-1-P 4'-kinase